jgi:HTH-type transcriptional regulator, cell division transcriptional repressor
MQAIPRISTIGPYNPDMPAGRPPTRPRTELGERIAQARQQAGLTQEQLAQKLGVNQRVVTYWERKPVALKPEQLADLAAALGVTGDFLLGRSEPKARGTGPTGKARQVFEAVSALPRDQQTHILRVVEAFVAQHRKAV